MDAYSFAIVLWELIHNKLPFEGMSNLQAAYAAAFKVSVCCLLSTITGYTDSVFNVLQNVRPSADELPEDLALIVTSCWKEDPNGRPNFSQIIQMLHHYLSTTAVPPPPEATAVPPRMFNVFLPDSPGTSTLISKEDEIPTTPLHDTPKGGPFSCFYRCCR